MSAPVLMLLGAALFAGGLAALFTAWKRRGGGALIIAGWTLLGLALIPFGIAGGADRGAAQGLTLAMAAALALVAWAGLRDPGKRRAARATSAGERTPRASLNIALTGRRALVFLLAGPAAAAAAVILSVAAFGLTSGIHPSNQLALTCLLFPIFWAVLAVAGAWQAPLKWRAGIIAASALLGALCIWLSF